ncbi:hypothetical protein A2U01_0077965, partial [Trifolium medium]|nr:hypothetical protein [Trifolium medium]
GSLSATVGVAAVRLEVTSSSRGINLL